MGFLQTIQKDLEQSLAEQRRAALVVVLRQRASAMTFDDLRQFLTSPLGKGFGSIKLAEVFDSLAPRPKPTKATPMKATPAKATPKPAKRPKRSVTKKRKHRGVASSTAPEQVRGKTGKRPGMSPEKAAALARYDDKVLGLIRGAGGWVASPEIRAQAGGTRMQMMRALRKLVAEGAVVRQGERSATQYRVVQS